MEFIFVEEEQMTVFRECTFCSAYATEQCGGCKKVQQAYMRLCNICQGWHQGWPPVGMG